MADSQVSAMNPTLTQTGMLAPVLQSFVDRKLVAGVVGLVANKEKILRRQRLARSARRSAAGGELEEVKLDKDLDAKTIARLSEGMPVPAPLLADFGVGKIFDYTRHYAEPADGLFSTAHELQRSVRCRSTAASGRGSVICQGTIQQMTSSQTGDVVFSPQETYGIGCSVKLRDDEGSAVGSFGHRGARRPVMWWILKTS